MSDDFDEGTDPRRRRPQGVPAPRHAVLPPGEPLIPTFLDWDAKGRIPEGSVLCEFTGTVRGFDAPGYTVVSGDMAGNRPRSRPDMATLVKYRIVSWLKAHGNANWYCVLAPRSPAPTATTGPSAAATPAPPAPSTPMPRLGDRARRVAAERAAQSNRPEVQS